MHVHLSLLCWTRAHAAAWKIPVRPLHLHLAVRRASYIHIPCEAPQAPKLTAIRLTPSSDQAERSISLLSTLIVVFLYALILAFEPDCAASGALQPESTDNCTRTAAAVRLERQQGQCHDRPQDQDQDQDRSTASHL